MPKKERVAFLGGNPSNFMDEGVLEKPKTSTEFKGLPL